MPGMMLGAGVLGACVGAAAVYGYMQVRFHASKRLNPEVSRI